VYVDRSHDWRFSYDDLADRMLAPAGFDVILSDASLSAVPSLGVFDVVVVQQISWPTAMPEQEMALLEGYVRQGGNLVLITKPGVPAEKLARRFGFGVKAGGGGPLRATEAIVALGAPKQIPTRAVRYHLAPAAGHTVLVQDARGNNVAAARTVGKGKVVVWADDHAYWDFCAQRDRQTGQVASGPATTAVFKWLVGKARGGTKGRVRRVFAENVEARRSLIFRYSLPSAKAAKGRIAQVDRVMAVVRKCNGMLPPAKPPFTIHWLSAGGGGWAGPHGAGVCVYGKDPAFPIKVMGHELTHSTTGPWPRAFNEGWAVIVGMRSAEAFGFADSARLELKRNLKGLNRVDRSRRTLDMMDSMTGPPNHNYQKKAIWMLLELEKRYGADFMVRFLARRSKRYGIRKAINLQQTFELFAETAGDPNIWTWFKQCGTSVQLVPPNSSRRSSCEDGSLGDGGSTIVNLQSIGLSEEVLGVVVFTTDNDPAGPARPQSAWDSGARRHGMCFFWLARQYRY